MGHDPLNDDKGGFLKKFLDTSALVDLFVISVLVLDAYLLQQSSNIYGRAGITQFPSSNIEIIAAQLTAVLILIKVINTLMDMGGDSR